MAASLKPDAIVYPIFRRKKDRLSAAFLNVD
jgi:hypothetical protein